MTPKISMPLRSSNNVLFILVMTYIATKLCFALAVMEVATEEVSFF